MSNTDKELVWHNDGHQIELRINRSELEIIEVSCQAEDSESICMVDGQCIVKFFINRFGMECNIGICSPSQYLEICWGIFGNFNDLEACQLWFVPINDEAFYAWMTSRLS